ncbi:MAG: threonine--tRNA ligase [Planctomycetota bacterium]|jgi:threonyl-tRNA synthetase
MRILGLHSDGFSFAAHERAMASAERITKREGTIEGDCLVVYISVEQGDEKDPDRLAKILVHDTAKRARELGVRQVVVYPYVHLSSKPSDPKTALKVLQQTELGLKALGDLDVHRSPFGWYKSFTVNCKGHPLSEWSGEYTPDSPLPEEAERIKREAKEKAPPEAKAPEAFKFSRLVLQDMDGETYIVTRDDWQKCAIWKKKGDAYKRLKTFVRNEIGGAPKPEAEGEAKEPPHITYMRKHELVDYCDVSEKGHYKWYPKGVLVQRLILDFAHDLALKWGASEMKNPIIIRGDNNVVGELMGEFHERDYQVDGGRGICYLRYASDPLGFPFMQKTRFTHHQTPLKVYEEASCFRNEQEGEVSGLKRVRNFLMTDMHAACSSVEEAKREFELLCVKFGELMNSLIAEGRWVLGWEGTEQFYDENRDYLVGIGRKLGVPAMFKLTPEMTHYYTIKNEYQSITSDDSSIQVSTVQWDVKDGERFDIGYIGPDGKKHPCPVIIHASSFGSIERTLCTILENIAIDAKKGKKAGYPLWLAPTQVRVVPVTEEFVDFALSMTEKLAGLNLRADCDERNETVGRRIRDAEKKWVPFICVVGEKEAGGEPLQVRVRGQKQQEKLTPEALADRVHAETEGLPFRPLPLPVRVSQRPIFFG